MLTMIGSYGWVNLQAVQSVERKDGGRAVIHMIDGTVIPLLPDEAVDLERVLLASRHSGPRGTGKPTGVGYEVR